MAYLRRAIDAVNNEIQFEVVEDASSINLKFDNTFSQSDLNLLKVRVEKVTKNQPDQTLYSGVMSDLKEILKFAFPQMGSVLPFALGKALELNDDNKIVVTLGLSGIEATKIPTSFEFELNKMIETQKNPLIIKKVNVVEELTFSTELYQMLLVSQDALSYETVVLNYDENGMAKPTKVFFGQEIMKSLRPINTTYQAFVTSPNQEVTLKGTSENFLISL